MAVARRWLHYLFLFFSLLLLLLLLLSTYTYTWTSQHLRTSADDAPLNLSSSSACQQGPLVVHLGAPSPPACDGQRQEQQELTLVTAFINIGAFGKGSASARRGVSMYSAWLRRYSLLTTNAVVLYTNDTDVAREFAKIRRGLEPLTVVVWLPQEAVDALWSFQLLPSIARVFHQPGYPRHHPNTVVPAYSCIMHAKYDFLSHAISANYFRSAYFAWVDVGEFRFLDEAHTPPFTVALPPGFDATAVAYNAVFDLQELAPAQIISRNLVWANGGLFLAQAPVMRRFAAFYRVYVEQLVAGGQMSTDQQVVYGMFSGRGGRAQHDLHVQTYQPGSTGYTGDAWMFISYYTSPQLRRIHCPKNESAALIKHFYGTKKA